ncbi:isoleucine--tRNA ligase, mitochondrial-like [Acanthaster planci]|uniref:isoleucine--tRNA ligase n=1 Tax=Acanthaster planci TaxID=133434 RepID=A0A8B7XEJ2_ACAPL|nr:isoleucine--tRNA ligase, mitochondrial-like [Acanthaster planci]
MFRIFKNLGCLAELNKCNRVVEKRCFASKKYADTLNLPKTSFELWGAGKREEDVRRICGFSELYSWQEQQTKRKHFCLHDGPPYANGDPHIGHGLNKILKDVINRYKLLRGYSIHYKPGWDCHGLPIELKALSENEDDFRKLSPPEIRKKARKFAEKAIDRQMKAFKKWGIMADWDSGCYFTFDKEYEASQLRLFHQMYQKGFIYRDLKPVNWSPSSRTALAEAELEYNTNHVSQSIYIKFPVSRLPGKLADYISDLYAAIWTTTPWTIPANEAICYMPAKDYCVVQCTETRERLLLAAERVEEMAQIWGKNFETIVYFEGSHLEGGCCLHPAIPGKTVPLLPAAHVKMSMGTGLVHTAPAHGPEDYGVAIQFNLPVHCMVDEDGIFSPEVGQHLAGKNILTDANDIVIEMLRASGNLLMQSNYMHSYPYDWRTKQPIIIRPSKQWFINTGAIKDRAMECLQTVEMLPSHALNSMRAQLEGRTFWCISRQRVWGVPIPVFYHRETGEPFITSESVNHVTDLIQKHGSDCWWELPMEELLPDNVAAKCSFKSSEFVKGEDILDIWFDSGSSWSHVLKDANEQADLYLEGEDQYGAWFQTSLLTSVAVNDRAPYRNLLVHGFTLDSEGRKMSKSLGNVVDPDVIVSGGENKKTDPVYGADVLRWRLAESSWLTRVQIGPELFAMTNQSILKVRNTIRYFLGNLYDFDPSVDLQPHADLLPIDKYMLHLLYDYGSKVTAAYDSYEFSEVTATITELIHGKISAFYLDTMKDRLYAEVFDSLERRSCQTVLYHMLEVIVRSIAPITPHLAEEAFLHSPDAVSIFKTGWFHCDRSWHQPELAVVFGALCGIRETFLATIHAPQSREYDVTICTSDPQLLGYLHELQQETTSCTSHLSELMMASFTTVATETEMPRTEGSIHVDSSIGVPLSDVESYTNYSLLIQPASHYHCNRCRKHTAEVPSQPCSRCLQAMSGGWE